METTRVQTLALVLPSDLQQGRGEETQEELALGQQGCMSASRGEEASTRQPESALGEDRNVQDLGVLVVLGPGHFCIHRLGTGR